VISKLISDNHGTIFSIVKYSMAILNRNRMKKDVLDDCLRACQECVIFCTRCAASCTEESNAQDLSRCIQLNLECAAMCNAAVQLMSLNGISSDSLCRLCADISRRCAEECMKHDSMKHCRDAASCCHECSIICSQMVSTINGQ
jgi:hypothetical protein